MRAVVLIGGRGQRLAPYTTVLPKPLMPLGDEPILKLLVDRLRDCAITDLVFAGGHLASLVEAYFGDGSRFGVDIEYSVEPEPLGTAAPLRLVGDLGPSFLLLNGDLVTDLDFRRMVSWHRQSGALATVGLRRHELPSDYGVIETDESGRVTGYVEKPVQTRLVSMGVYVLDRATLDHLPPEGACDLPELLNRLVARDLPVMGFVHEGYWVDIGHPEEYRQAAEDFERHGPKLFGIDRSPGPERSAPVLGGTEAFGVGAHPLDGPVEAVVEGDGRAPAQ